MVQAVCLLMVAGLGALLVGDAVSLQSRELSWLRASTDLSPPSAVPPRPSWLGNPQAWDLQARWLSLQAARAPDVRTQVAHLRESAEAAARHVRQRPQWSMAWLSWAKIMAQLHPAGREWQQALRRALELGDRGWAFQGALAQLLLTHESFMDRGTRAAVEVSLLHRRAENEPWMQQFMPQGYLPALCASPVSDPAVRACVAGAVSD